MHDYYVNTIIISSSPFFAGYKYIILVAKQSSLKLTGSPWWGCNGKCPASSLRCSKRRPGVAASAAAAAWPAKCVCSVASRPAPSPGTQIKSYAERRYLTGENRERISNERVPTSCLGRVFNSELGHIGTRCSNCISCMQPLLKLITRPRLSLIS